MLEVIADLSRVKDLEHEYMLACAARQMSMIIGGPHFLPALHEEIEKSNKLEGEKSIWKDATPLQIFAALHTKPHKIELTIETYHTWKNVIGYGLPSDTIIRVNKKYLNRYDLHSTSDRIKIASNLLHEHGHDMGFKHDFLRTKRRTNSICYVLNRVYEKAAQKHYGV